MIRTLLLSACATDSAPAPGTAGDAVPVFWSAIAVGDDFLCALDGDGAVACTPELEETTGSTAPSGSYTQISASFDHACVLDAAGALACWGADEYGQCSGAPPGPFTEVGAYGWSTCAVVASTGLTECWGRSDFGILEVPAVPVQDLSGRMFTACALDEGRLAHCWGQDLAGETDVPADLGPVAEIAPTTSITYYTTASGAVRTFHGTAEGAATGFPGGTWTSLVGGWSSVCALSGGDVACILGGDPPEGPFVDLSLVEYVACALNDAGAVACWAADEVSGVSVPDPATLAFSEP